MSHAPISIQCGGSMAQSRDDGPTVKPEHARIGAEEQSRDLRNTVREAMARSGAVGPAMSQQETARIMRQARRPSRAK
jgi:hypothetical protein